LQNKINRMCAGMTEEEIQRFINEMEKLKKLKENE
jgi:hypothetical protein